MKEESECFKKRQRKEQVESYVGELTDEGANQWMRDELESINKEGF